MRFVAETQQITFLFCFVFFSNEDDRDTSEKAKRVKKKSEYRRPVLGLAVSWCGNGYVESLLDNEELVRTFILFVLSF